MELFKNVRRQVANQLDQMKLAREIEQLSNAVRDNPANVDALKRLAEAYQESGNLEAAISHFMRLADVYRSSKQYELALVFYRKVERMVEPAQRATILKNIVNIYFETRQFDRAYEYCRQVISLYLSEQQPEAAMGFLKMLPGFGEKDADYRKELREMIQERSEKWMQGAKATWVTEENSSRAQKDKDQEDFSDRLVLLVDDEPHVLMILEKIIKPLGCQIMTANNGLEALNILKQHTPALIISDLMMPKMDGSQLFAALQDDPNLAKIPFVCLSSRAQEDEKVSALELGVEDYWAKPFSVREIPLKVKRILKRQPATTRVGGQLSHTSLTDILNQMERERKEGVVKIVTPSQETGTIYFKDGAAVDAESGSFTGIAAIIHMVQWSEGSYVFTQQPVTRPNVINMRASELILEALHRYDEEQGLIAALPPPSTPATLPPGFDASWLAGFPPEKVRRVMALIDGKRTVGQCIQQAHHDIDLLRIFAVLWSPGSREQTPPPASNAPLVPPPSASPIPPASLPTSPSLPSYPATGPLHYPAGQAYPTSQPYPGGAYPPAGGSAPLVPQAPYLPPTAPPYSAQTFPPAYPPAGYGQAGYGQGSYPPPPQPTYAPPGYQPPYTAPSAYGATPPPGQPTLPPLIPPAYDPGVPAAPSGYTAPPSSPSDPPPPAFQGEYRVTFTDPAKEEALARQLYDAVVAAKRQCGESIQDFTFARFHRILCDQSAKIKSQLNCTHISFSVSVDNGRVKFIAKGL